MAHFRKLAVFMFVLFVIVAALLVFFYQKAAVTPAQAALEAHMAKMAEANAHHIDDWLNGIIQRHDAAGSTTGILAVTIGLTLCSIHPRLRGLRQKLDKGLILPSRTPHKGGMTNDRL